MRKVDPANHGKKRAFIAAFRVTSSITAAAEAAKVKRTDHKDWLRHDAVYRAAWETAQEEVCESLEVEAIRRARDGVKKPVLYKGKPVRTGRGKNSKILYDVEYSDQLLIVLLKRFMPDAYRERTVTEVTGAVEIIDRLQAARARLVQMQEANERSSHEQSTGTAG